MRKRASHTTVLCYLAGVAAVVAASSADAFVAGGGAARTDCLAAWQVTTPGVTANHGRTGVDCQDGDPACDVDGQENGTCTFGISACTASLDVAGCSAAEVTDVVFNARTSRLGLTAPALPTAEATCGTATVVPVPLRSGPRGAKPSRPVTLKLTAKTAAGTDRDSLRLRCVPNVGAGQCPDNPNGGPRELNLVVGAAGTDLDNGFTGQSHNFPVPGGSTLRMCLAGCDRTTNATCVQDDAATGAVQSATFGPPLPLLAGVPTCIVNRFAAPGLSGGSADLLTGEIQGDLHLLSDVYLTSELQVCPVCSGNDVGETGVCKSGRRVGQACRTESIMEVTGVPAANRRLTVSADCQPAGQPVGTLSLTLPLTTGTATLEGPQACGAKQDDGCGGNACDAACTGNACVATTETGECIDVKGGVSQVCCSNNTQLPCFPTATSGIVRSGIAGVPTPAWPDETYPKSGDARLVSTFCEPATGSAVVDIVTGLPGPGALTLPVSQTWVP
jgi:hypothetical protein